MSPFYSIFPDIKHEIQSETSFSVILNHFIYTSITVHFTLYCRGFCLFVFTLVVPQLPHCERLEAKNYVPSVFTHSSLPPNPSQCLQQNMAIVCAQFMLAGLD